MAIESNEFLKDTNALEGIAELRTRLEQKVILYTNERKEIEDFIETIEDQQMQTICRLRFIENLPLDQIGYLTYMDRSTVGKKLNRFLDSIK